MPTLSDKLKALGVKVGTQDLKPLPSNPYTIEQILPGRLHTTQGGYAFIVENRYPPNHTHGDIHILGLGPLDILAEWAGESRIRQCRQQAFAYLDIETTGLSGGAGTYAFLIGVGRFDGEEFQLSQFFMRDPIEEPALLLALEEFLAPCETLVTYNGKAFDVPILNARFTTHGWKTPFPAFSHLDLLHLSRKLWRERLPSRTLGNIETFVLGAQRTEEDVPGWMIPQMYFDYLRSGDARPLKSVFYHNAMDVIAMAALLNHISHLLADPQHASIQHNLDLVGMGKLHEDLGRLEEAVGIYKQCLQGELPVDLLWEIVQRLSFLNKRLGNYPDALALWMKAAENNQIYAHLELAKYFEHHVRDYAQAIYWAREALNQVNSPGFSRVSRMEWLPELEHRLERLERLENKRKINE